MGESWELKCRRSDYTFQHASREWHLINQNQKTTTKKCNFFFSRLQPITSLSRTNYAERKCRSPSNGLCCRGSLEGRSFIPFSTSIYPRGFCSSVARRVSFHLLRIHLCLSVWLWGWEGEGKQKCVKKPLCAPVARRDLCTSVYAHAGYRCMCCFPNVCAARAARRRGS